MEHESERSAAPWDLENPSGACNKLSPSVLKHGVKIDFTCFSFTPFNAAIRKSAVPYGACVLVLLDGAALTYWLYVAFFTSSSKID